MILTKTGIYQVHPIWRRRVVYGMKAKGLWPIVIGTQTISEYQDQVGWHTQWDSPHLILVLRGIAHT